MNIQKQTRLNKWTEFTIENDHGMAVSILNYGGVITKIMVPDRNGQIENVVLGYRNDADYETNPHFFGALIGRVAGRIENAAFELDGTTYNLEKNEGSHHLHGGSKGLHQVIWDSETFYTSDTAGLKLTSTSEDRDGGYPGNVKISVTYTLNNANELALDYLAESDKDTPLSLTNHSYFNLSGDLKTTVEHHHVAFDNERVIELDHELIPTGNTLKTGGTNFDFREGRFLSDGFHSDHEQNRIVGNGYDHYFIFNHEGKVFIKDKQSGRNMTVKTDQPGMVMYTANGLGEGLPLREGLSRKHLGVCFEAQSHPASLNHEGFTSVILQAGKEYQQQTVFSFGVDSD